MLKAITNVIFLMLIVNSLAKKASQVPYAQIKDCQQFDDPNIFKEDGKINQLYQDELKSKKVDCKHLDLYAYTTELYKSINCLMRTDLPKKVAVPLFMQKIMSNISKSLRGAGDKSISDIQVGAKVYRGTGISEKNLIKEGNFFKNLSFLSTSTVNQASQFTSRDGNYLIIFTPKDTGTKLFGKVIENCSKYKKEKEFLLDRNQCWKITKIAGNTIHMLSVLCKNGTKYGML